ncbi:MAG: hypothetical protein S4CHLAM6_13030 [Chlamydiae bacterium]|nr:hypothetical protein [Chlamydiota bacterium]
MQVEANAQTSAKGGVNPAQVQYQESQTIVIMSLLRKAAKDILKDIQGYKIDTLESAKSKGKSSSVGAQAPKPSKSSKSAEAPKASGDAIIEAFIAQLTANRTVAKVSKELVQKLVHFVLSQLSGLSMLQQEIEALKKELSGSIPKDEVKILTAELTSLESEYSSVLAGYNSASSDYNKLQKAATADAEAYSKAQEAYNKLPAKEKSGPEGKKLKKEMSFQRLAELSAEKGMAIDQSKIKSDELVMETVKEGLTDLAKRYPSIGKSISGIISIIDNHGSISAAAAALNKQVASTAAEDAKIEGKISSLQAQEQALIHSISSGSSTIEKALQGYLNSSKTITAAAMKEILNGFLGTVISHNSHRVQIKEDDDEAVSRITHKTVETHDETPVYRHRDQKAIHDVAERK